MTRNQKLYALLLVVPIILLTVLFGYLVVQDAAISIRDVRITNLTDSSATITWISDSAYQGAVVYQEHDIWPAVFAQLGKKIFQDDRDNEELIKQTPVLELGEGAEDNNRNTHHVTVSGLKPASTYYFRIAGAVNGKTAEIKSFTTSQTPADIKTPDPAYGQVESDVINYDDSILTLNAGPEGRLISTVMNNSGRYSVDFNSLTADGQKPESLELLINSGAKLAEKYQYKNLVSYKPLEKIILVESDALPTDTTAQNVLGVVSASGNNAVPTLVASICGKEITTTLSLKTISNLNLRRLPGVTSPIVNSFAEGTELYVLPGSGGLPRTVGCINQGGYTWIQVSTDPVDLSAQSGWAALNFLTQSPQSETNNNDNSSDGDGAREEDERSTCESFEGDGPYYMTSKPGRTTYIYKSPPIMEGFLGSNIDAEVGLNRADAYGVPGLPYTISPGRIVKVVDCTELQDNRIEEKIWLKVQSLDDINSGWVSPSRMVHGVNASATTPNSFYDGRDFDTKTSLFNEAVKLAFERKFREMYAERMQQAKFNELFPSQRRDPHFKYPFDSLLRSCSSVPYYTAKFNLMTVHSNSTDSIDEHRASPDLANMKSLLDFFADEFTGFDSISSNVNLCISGSEWISECKYAYDKDRNRCTPPTDLVRPDLRLLSNLPENQQETRLTDDEFIKKHIEIRPCSSNLASALVGVRESDLIRESYFSAIPIRSYDPDTKRIAALEDYRNSLRKFVIKEESPRIAQYRLMEGCYFTYGTTNIADKTYYISDAYSPNGIMKKLNNGVIARCADRGGSNTDFIEVTQPVDELYALIYSLGRPENTCWFHPLRDGSQVEDISMVGISSSQVPEGQIDIPVAPVGLDNLAYFQSFGQTSCTGRGLELSKSRYWGECIEAGPGSSLSLADAQRLVEYNMDPFYASQITYRPNVSESYRVEEENRYHIFLTLEVCKEWQRESINDGKYRVSDNQNVEMCGESGRQSILPRSLSTLGLAKQTQSLQTIAPKVLGQSQAQLQQTQPQAPQQPSQSLEVTESGRYSFFENGEKIAEQDVIVSAEKVELRLFADNNGNGLKDAGEEYFASERQVNLTKEASLEEFSLNSGWNLIHLPLIDARIEGAVNSAAKLVDYWNEQGADVRHVARFIGGQFQIFSKRETGTQYTQDFELVPGEGIFVLNRAENVKVSFSGKRYDGSLPLKLQNGWNLVGIINGGLDMNSEELLKKAEGQGVTADTISQFESGSYQSVIRKDELLFGNNFKIIDKKGYFIKVESGTAKEFDPGK